MTHSIISIGHDPIAFLSEIKYLGMYITAGKHFSCNLHYNKIKFFRALNAILCKIGDTSAISLILSLASTNCFPILLYGLEAMHLNKTQINSLTYAFNSIFYKLFHTFHQDTI